MRNRLPDAARPPDPQSALSGQAASAAQLPLAEHDAQDAEVILRAIRYGDVDAVVVTRPGGEARVYTLESSDRPYQTLIEQIQEGALTLKEDGTILYCNQRLAVMTGVPLERLIGRPLQAFLGGADAAALQAMVAAAIAASVRGELTIQAADGTQLAIYLSLSVLRRIGEPPIVCGIVTDLTEQKTHLREMAAAVSRTRLLAAELAGKHEQLRVTLESIGDAVITTDGQGRIAWLNPAAERLTGWTQADAAGRPPSEVFRICNEETRVPLADPLAACIAAGQTVATAGQTLLLSRHGGEFGIEGSAAPIRNAEGQTPGAVLVFHDVTKQRRVSGEMSYRATHDTLTGLINRAEFEVRLQFALHKARADGSQSMLLFVDLDHFKLVNDTSGHAAGDRLLQLVARMLAEPMRGSDTLARLGGDEFAIILEHCSPETGLSVARRICARMDDFRFSHGERRFRIGASVGLVAIDRRWPTSAAVLQAGDSACYAAKEAGRNRVHAWSDTDQSARVRRAETQMATRLQQALEADRFVLFAQRLRRLRGGAAEGVHAELLLRMPQGDGALALPAAFLPAAERFHLLTQIDRWVLERAVRWLAAAPARVELLCVNLSAQSLAEADFRAWAFDLLRRAGPPACRRLCLELTEIAVVANLADATEMVARVQELGVRLALDDFGAEASSFSYLKSLPVDFLKISGQFVRDLVGDPLNEVAVRGFADVASVLAMRTVAKCVETHEVLSKLRLMGIDFAQGFSIHRPAPVGELERDGGPGSLA